MIVSQELYLEYIALSVSSSVTHEGYDCPICKKSVGWDDYHHHSIGEHIVVGLVDMSDNEYEIEGWLNDGS